jgi:hypothetical protein
MRLLAEMCCSTLPLRKVDFAGVRSLTHPWPMRGAKLRIRLEEKVYGRPM